MCIPQAAPWVEKPVSRAGFYWGEGEGEEAQGREPSLGCRTRSLSSRLHVHWSLEPHLTTISPSYWDPDFPGGHLLGVQSWWPMGSWYLPSRYGSRRLPEGPASPARLESQALSPGPGPQVGAGGNPAQETRIRRACLTLGPARSQLALAHGGSRGPVSSQHVPLSLVGQIVLLLRVPRGLPVLQGLWHGRWGVCGAERPAELAARLRLHRSDWGRALG